MTIQRTPIHPTIYTIPSVALRQEKNVVCTPSNVPHLVSMYDATFYDTVVHGGGNIAGYQYALWAYSRQLAFYKSMTPQQACMTQSAYDQTIQSYTNLLAQIKSTIATLQKEGVAEYNPALVTSTTATVPQQSVQSIPNIPNTSIPEIETPTGVKTIPKTTPTKQITPVTTPTTAKPSILPLIAIGGVIAVLAISEV